MVLLRIALALKMRRLDQAAITRGLFGELGLQRGCGRIGGGKMTWRWFCLRPPLRLQQREIARPQHGLHPGPHAERVARAGQMSLHGAARNAQDLADVTSALALLDPGQALELPVAESRPGRRSPAAFGRRVL